jgi:hypothetical protein
MKQLQDAFATTAVFTPLLEVYSDPRVTHHLKPLIRGSKLTFSYLHGIRGML